jgi:hypothetical protein
VLFDALFKQTLRALCARSCKQIKVIKVKKKNNIKYSKTFGCFVGLNMFAIRNIFFFFLLLVIFIFENLNVLASQQQPRTIDIDLVYRSVRQEQLRRHGRIITDNNETKEDETSSGGALDKNFSPNKLDCELKCPKGGELSFHGVENFLKTL